MLSRVIIINVICEEEECKQGKEKKKVMVCTRMSERVKTTKSRSRREMKGINGSSSKSVSPSFPSLCVLCFTVKTNSINKLIRGEPKSERGRRRRDARGMNE
jgi:hypothetical protein